MAGDEIDWEQDIAVAVICFARPTYLRSTVEALETCVDKEEVDWIFFQDGAVNKFSGERRAYDSDIDASISVAKGADLPNKEIRVNDENLCNAIQTDKCYQLLENGYDKVIRVEEDVILSKYFIRVLLSISQQFPDTAPSPYTFRPISECTIPDDLDKVAPEKAAFITNLMRSDVFHDIKPRWEEFRDIIYNTDWWGGMRPQEELLEKFGPKSRGCDGVLDNILSEYGYKVVAPYVSRGKNIGKKGMNTSPQQFNSKYGKEGQLEYEFDREVTNWRMV